MTALDTVGKSEPTYREWADEMARGGWTFVYEQHTRYVAAIHPRGGQRSIIGLGWDVPHDLGREVARLLMPSPSTSGGTDD